MEKAFKGGFAVTAITDSAKLKNKTNHHKNLQNGI
jgi:hypothetical protein